MFSDMVYVERTHVGEIFCMMVFFDVEDRDDFEFEGVGVELEVVSASFDADGLELF